MGEYNICFNADNNYTEQIGVAITSIIKNSDKDDKFNFYVLDGGFTKESKEQIQELAHIKDFKIYYVKMNLEDFKDCPLLKDYNQDFKHFHVPMSAYFRFKMASIFPKMDKILYLDCDLVVTGSLKGLWETELNDNYAAMVPDVESENEAERLNLPTYCNAGVMLINLAKWREDNVEQKLFEYAENNKDKILWQDQDVINVVFKEKVKVLPRKWNFQFFQYDPSRYEGLFEKYYEYNILHFCGRYKPWNNETIHPLFNEYYTYLLLTPWKKNIINYKKQVFDKFFSSDIKGSALYEEVSNAQKYADEKITANNAELYKYTENIVNAKSMEFNEAVSTLYKFIENRNLELTVQEDSKIVGVFEAIEKVYKYAEELRIQGEKKTESKISDVFGAIDKVYKYAEDLRIQEEKNTDGKIAGVFDAIDKVYKYAEDLKSQEEKNADSKIAGVFDAIDKVYKYAEERARDKNDEIYSSIGKLENKISSVEHNSKIEIHEQKEFLNRLIQTKTDNLRSFFEDAIKTQLDILKRTYENLSSQQKSLYEAELKNKTTYQEEMLDSRLENQKAWYENEIQKQINDNNSWHVNNLNEKLKEQQDFYKNELAIKQEDYNAGLCELQAKVSVLNAKIKPVSWLIKLTDAANKFFRIVK